MMTNRMIEGNGQEMRASKIIVTAAGVVLAVGGVTLAQSSFASEVPAHSTKAAQSTAAQSTTVTTATPETSAAQSAVAPPHILNGVTAGVIHSWNPVTGVGLIFMDHFMQRGLPEALQFGAGAIPGGLNGAFAHHLAIGAEVVVTWINLGTGAPFVTRLS
jgi:hypothetical protein